MEVTAQETQKLVMIVCQETSVHVNSMSWTNTIVVLELAAFIRLIISTAQPIDLIGILSGIQ